MTNDEIDEHLAHIEATAQFLRRMKRAPQPPEASGGYITPSQATAICGRSESQIRRDCESNPTDLGGFGLKIGGRWYVKRDVYIEMRGNARFRR